MPATEFAGVLVRARTGDADAFAWLFRRTQPLLLRYLNVLGGADVCDDVASETWVSVVRDLGSFDGDEDAFRAWLSQWPGIAWSTSEGRKPAGRPYPRRTCRRITGPTPDAADEVVDREGTEWALSLIATLPADQAEAVLLRVVVGLDAGAVGQVMGRTSGAVRVLTHRGLKSLHQRLSAPSHTEV